MPKDKAEILPYLEPTTSESINKIVFDWPDYQLIVTADRLTESGVCELMFHHNNGDGRKLLHITKANLLSTQAHNAIIKRMAEHQAIFPWREILTKITNVTMEYQRRGEPAVIIEPTPGEIEKPGYFVEPLIMKGVPSIIYGDKGVNKTTLALASLGLLFTGCDDTQFGLVAERAAKIGLLDWESSRELTNYTCSRLIEGGTVPYFQLNYLRCKMTLAEDIERIANFITDNKIEVVLIDSLGQAAGSDKFDSSGKASALKFFECLRQLNVTSLIIAQNSKGTDSNQKTIYGSTYFTYYARNIFELKKAKEQISDTEMSIALFHQESNYSKKYETKGFRIVYTDQSIKITSEVVNFSQFMDKISQPALILDFLRNGPQSRTAIMKLLDKTNDQINPVLSRLKKQNKIIDLGSGMWGLATNEDGDENI